MTADPEYQYICVRQRNRQTNTEKYVQIKITEKDKLAIASPQDQKRVPR